MYSRNRTPTPEERYRNNLPPLYSGSHFQYARQRENGGIRATDDRAPVQPAPPTQSDLPVQLAPAEQLTQGGQLAPAEHLALGGQLAPMISETESHSESAADVPIATENPPALPPQPKKASLPLSSIAGLGQEELLLIAILLLLCAEHDRAMDIIVILLLLLSVK